MFWRFGGYANISAIETILDKPEFTLEELLDEGDLIQELKQHNSKLLDYLRQREVLAKLLEYVVVPKLEPVAVSDDEADEEPDVKGKGRALPFGRARASSGATDPGNEEEEAEKKRNKYAYVSCEILSSDNWSICEVLMETGSRDLLFKFWEFLKRPTPLDPLQASYFTKVNESLFDKKTEEMIEFLNKVDNAVPDMLRHVDCPMIMDLLLKIISLERVEHGNGIVEWLYGKDLMPTLLSFLDPKNSWATQTSAGDFLKAIITVSANASQNEQTCIGPNELTRQLVSRTCVSQLIGYMLGGGNALTVGVGIVIEVIRKNNSDYDPDVGADPTAVPSSRDPIYLGTLLRMFADNVPNFITLVQNAPAQKSRLQSTFGDKIEPLGFDRFKTCELMAELLHCSNMGLLNEVGAEALIQTRDIDRTRLRDEGKLSSARIDDLPPGAEDITLRTATEPEEVRRLEVTNATDDDGFEEVTHSGEVGEDTSHEFVKAEDELPSNSPALFLGKDEEDDFVEEPLSSPRLRVHDVPPTDAQFEDPDMVVAPLSPSKKKQSSSPEKGATSVEDTREKMEDLSLDEKNQSEKESSTDHDAEPVSVEKEPADDLESPIMFAPTVPSIEKPDDLKVDTPASAGLTAGQKPPIVKDLSPHPEDTPAPLFSRSTSQPALSSEGKSSSDAAEDKEKVSETKESQADTKTAEKSAETSAVTAGEAKADTTADAPQPSAEADLPPVVGDFLKRQFVEHRVVPTILSFFFSYPWNNFLHNVVYDIVQQVFNGPMDRGFNPVLAISLFEAADVTNRIIKGQQKSEDSQSQNKTRMGYMGHLTLIAEEVVKFTERHPPELLSDVVLEKVMAQNWVSYVEGALAETRERDNAILGGVRPEVAMSNRAAASGLAGVGLSGLGSALGLGNQGSSALADAGLNGGLGEGNGDASVGPFSISAAISSGFHSSSDEDGDDAEDNDEDVNQEFRAYTDPLNASSNHPPSIPPPPPPPPPLNIPPSRARLQLAARLAMNKRNAAAASTHENGGSGAEGSDAAVLSPDPESSSSGGLMQPAPIQRLRNPFADDADDEDDDEDGDRDDDDEDSSWNRGGWWRGVVRGGRRGGEQEKFGDGRDDESDSEGDEDDDVGEDEEFGDFAMPEEKEGAEGEGEPEIDQEREKVLLKPLPVHPPQAGSSKFGSLWPFGKKEDEGKEEGAATGSKKSDDEEEVVVGEEVKRVKEAKSRRSLDDPDDEEVVV